MVATNKLGFTLKLPLHSTNKTENVFQIYETFWNNFKHFE